MYKTPLNYTGSIGAINLLINCDWISLLIIRPEVRAVLFGVLLLEMLLSQLWNYLMRSIGVCCWLHMPGAVLLLGARFFDQLLLVGWVNTWANFLSNVAFVEILLPRELLRLILLVHGVHIVIILLLLWRGRFILALSLWRKYLLL